MHVLNQILKQIKKQHQLPNLKTAISTLDLDMKQGIEANTPDTSLH